jgi:hypothetical protein
VACLRVRHTLWYSCSLSQGQTASHSQAALWLVSGSDIHSGILVACLRVRQLVRQPCGLSQGQTANQAILLLVSRSDKYSGILVAFLRVRQLLGILVTCIKVRKIP